MKEHKFMLTGFTRLEFEKPLRTEQQCKPFASSHHTPAKQLNFPSVSISKSNPTYRNKPPTLSF